ncbi:MAG: hypothetical protein JOZ72_04950 [Alphaproteobacteria bacterium]|nr:hypothetical protein [Alphaproteobacteria bacterium]
MAGPGRSRAIFHGVALTAIGLLIFVPSGLCTATLGGSAAWNLIAGTDDGGMPAILIMALVFGGPFVVVGALFIRAGIRALRDE